MSFILLAALILAALPTAGLGLIVIWHIARPQHPGADASNRLNKARLLWFALTREELFVPLFPWLARDEHDNVSRPP